MLRRSPPAAAASFTPAINLHCPSAGKGCIGHRLCCCCCCSGKVFPLLSVQRKGSAPCRGCAWCGVMLAWVCGLRFPPRWNLSPRTNAGQKVLSVRCSFSLVGQPGEETAPPAVGSSAVGFGLRLRHIPLPFHGFDVTNSEGLHLKEHSLLQRGSPP